MTYDKFMTEMIGYYGEHKNKYVFMVTIKFIKSEFKEEQLPELRAALYDQHQSQWGFPDIATINKSIKKFRDDKTVGDKNESYTEYYEDLSISDDEWKQGFKGLEALKRAVKIDEPIKAINNTHIPHCRDCQFKPFQTSEGFEEHKECKDCGTYHSNFKQRFTDD